MAEFAEKAWKQAATGGALEVDAGKIAQVLLPFVLGFSTSLVLTIMSRLIAGIETMFGVTRR